MRLLSVISRCLPKGEPLHRSLTDDAVTRLAAAEGGRSGVSRLRRAASAWSL